MRDVALCSKPIGARACYSCARNPERLEIDDDEVAEYDWIVPATSDGGKCADWKAEVKR